MCIAMSQDETSVVTSLDALLEYSLKGKHPSTSRLHTLKAMVVLGKGWHKSREITRELSKLKINTNYIFELAGRYPDLVEADAQNNQARIRDDAFPTVSRLIDEYIRRVLSAKTHKA